MARRLPRDARDRRAASPTRRSTSSCLASARAFTAARSRRPRCPLHVRLCDRLFDTGSSPRFRWSATTARSLGVDCPAALSRRSDLEGAHCAPREWLSLVSSTIDRAESCALLRNGASRLRRSRRRRGRRGSGRTISAGCASCPRGSCRSRSPTQRRAREARIDQVRGAQCRAIGRHCIRAVETDHRSVGHVERRGRRNAARYRSEQGEGR